MLILILIDIQHSQKAVSSFEKGSKRQNHLSSGSFHLVKNPPSKIAGSSHPTGENLPPPPAPYHYSENPASMEHIFCQLQEAVLLRIF